MEDVPTPKDLRGAGAVAQTLAYVVGLAGIVAGTVLFQSDEPWTAVAVWVVTFAAGALLMIASFLVRSMAALLARIARIESDVSVLVSDRGRTSAYGNDAGGEPDPWRRHA